jgi:hypothetical protein
MLSLLIASIIAMLELRASLDVVQLETRLVSDLTEYESDQSIDSDSELNDLDETGRG